MVITPRIEENVKAAFETLHRRYVCHGDIRPANIIVRPDETVLLIDFERSVLNADKLTLVDEEDEVRHMLESGKSRYSSGIER